MAVTAVLLVGTVVALAASGDRGKRGKRGKPGPAGLDGRQGKPGLPGDRGPGSLRQDISVNWQNGQSTGRDRESFVAPGIGRGEVICNNEAQQLRFEPYERSKDTTMWIVRAQDKGYGAGTELVVRTARREFNTGDRFNEGLNWQGFDGGGTETSATGTFIGLVSSRGERSEPGGPAPGPTSFRLSWHWNFGDGNNRCYVAATFLTRYPNAP